MQASTISLLCMSIATSVAVLVSHHVAPPPNHSSVRTSTSFQDSLDLRMFFHKFQEQSGFAYIMFRPPEAVTEDNSPSTTFYVKRTKKNQI